MKSEERIAMRIAVLPGGPEAIFLPLGQEVLQWPWLPACFFSQIWVGRSNVWP